MQLFLWRTSPLNPFRYLVLYLEMSQLECPSTHWYFTSRCCRKSRTLFQLLKSIMQKSNATFLTSLRVYIASLWILCKRYAMKGTLKIRTILTPSHHSFYWHWQCCMFSRFNALHSINGAAKVQVLSLVEMEHLFVMSPTLQSNNTIQHGPKCCIRW